MGLFSDRGPRSSYLWLFGMERSRLERTCEVNAACENSSFIFTVCVKSVPRYHFKLAYVVLQMAVKEFFETHL